MSYDSQRQKASGHMGGYTLKPVTKSDKKMSKIHLKHRAKLEKMAEKMGDNHKKVLAKSVEYNKEHIDDHVKALQKAKKKLSK